jgi:dynein heavy chain
LDEAMPAFEAATRQLDTLDRNDITILKSFQNPPQPVKKTMEAVWSVKDAELLVISP